MTGSLGHAIYEEYDIIITTDLEDHNRSILIHHFRSVNTKLDESKRESFVIIYHFLDYILLLLENDVDVHFDDETYKRIENYFNQMINLKNARESGFLTLGHGTRAGPDKFPKIIFRYKNRLPKNFKTYYKTWKKQKIVAKNTHKRKSRNQTRKESGDSSVDEEYSGGKRRRRKTYKKSRRKNSKKTQRK